MDPAPAHRVHSRWKRLFALLGIYVFGNLTATALTYFFAELGWFVFVVYAVPVMFTAVPIALLMLGRRGAVSTRGDDTQVWAIALYLVAIGTWLFVLWLWWENARDYLVQ